MRKLWPLALLWLLAVGMHGQIINGYTSQNGTTTSNNRLTGDQYRTGPYPTTAMTCTIYVGSGGTSGNHVDCPILQQTGGVGGFVSTYICNATYTFPSAAVNAFVTISYTNCNLNANQQYYVTIISDDAGMTFGTTTVCNISCNNTSAGWFNGYGTAQIENDNYHNQPYANVGFGSGLTTQGGTWYVTSTVTKPPPVPSIAGAGGGMF